MIRRIILLSPILFFICLLSACSSTSAVKGPEFDANVDIYAIEDAVRVFQKLTDSAKSDSSIENIFLVAGCKILGRRFQYIKLIVSKIIENCSRPLSPI